MFAPHWFNQAEHADVLLHLSTTQAPCKPKSGKGTKRARGNHKEDEDAQEYARTYHAHAVILSSQSDFFESSLKRNWQEQASSSSSAGDSGIRHTLVVYVEEAELEGAELVLRSMYSGALPSSELPPSPVLLFTAFMVADRLAPKYQEVIAKGLASVPLESIDLALLQRVFSAPAAMREMPSLAALLASCQSRLVQLYGNVPDVITSQDLKRQFCALPHAAVLAWLQSDDLVVHSENCIVFLVTAWVKAQEQQGQPCSPAQLEQLAHEVRVVHLGYAYLCCVLPKLEWFEGCSSMNYLPVLTMYKAKGIPEGNSGAWDGAAAWRSCARSVEATAGGGGNATAGGGGSMEWALGAEQLKTLQGLGKLYAPSTYINGMMLQLSVQAVPCTSSVPGCTLSMNMCVDGPGMAAAVAWSVAEDAVVYSCSISIKGPQALHRTKSCSGLSLSARGRSWSDFLGKSAPSMAELLAPYLVEGKLHITCTWSKVDQA